MSFKRNTKLIVLDEITRKFLSELRTERKLRGLTLKETAGYIGCVFSKISEFERGDVYPSLETLMRLSELYEYDISGSVNYRYYHGKISSNKILSEMKRYKLTCKELTCLTGFGLLAIYRAVHMDRGASLECISSILSVIEREKELSRFRERQYGRK